ncbi:diguanylate cyclase domain-containing protein [Bacillus sp. ISL-7]|uniref:diguanylate cyclase domain-containing protein n=1 Tax=Bacillus sp. ISL-7 TaxID=2819136 RepID=UPI002034D068|nr:diguanylate cyclase [Bacillus sp. ISL-7]
MEAKRKKQFVGILFIDFDRFKDINDSLGPALAVIKYKATILADPLQSIWWRSFSKWEMTPLYFNKNQWILESEFVDVMAMEKLL